MKSLWTIVSTLALANLLAIVGFVGWLSATDRLSRERVGEIRTLLAGTVTDAQAEKKAAEAAALKAQAEQAESARMAKPPMSAADKITRDRDAQEAQFQAKLRLDTELRSLREFLVRENQRLQNWEAELTTREQSFEAKRKAITDSEGAEQFKKVLATLGGVKPKEAQSMLNELISQGKQTDAVAYLNSMDERSRAKIVAEFNKADPRVAAELLESLRKYGLPSTPENSSETSSHAADSK